MSVSNTAIQRQKFGMNALVLFLVVGIIFAGVGLFGVIGTKIDRSWIKTSAEVVDFVKGRSTSKRAALDRPVFEYSVDGKSYRVASNIGSQFNPVIGDRGEVAYNPNQADQAKVVEGTSNWLFLLLFPLVGISFLIMGPVLFVRSLRRSKHISDLIRTGQKLEGILVEVQPANGINVQSGNKKDRDMYKILVSATDLTGIVQNYISDPVVNVGGLTMVDFRNNPISIDVYVNPTDSQDYYVDISDLPNITSQRVSELVQLAKK